MTNQRGLTLIEILIVLAILASMLAFLPKFRSNPKNNIKAVARELAINAKQIRHSARTKNATFRLVFNMGSGEDSYSVETASGSVLIKSEKSEKDEESMSEDDKPKSPFAKTKVPGMKESVSLPRGLFIMQVETSSRPTPQTAGNAFVYFSPEGLIEKSAVQIGDGKNMVWTLIFNPLTGHTDVVEKAISLKEVSAE